MTIQNTENANIEPVVAIRPSLSFESITFSDGQTLTFEDDEIVVFVGPNNAGKSASLRELQAWITNQKSQMVITNAIIKRNGNGNDLKKYLEAQSLKLGIGGDLTYSGFGYSIHNQNIHFFENPTHLTPVAQFFCAHIATETRISGANPAGTIALHQSPPTHPIHQLMMDPELAMETSELFKSAFGEDLVVFRAGGSSFPLHVGKLPKKEAGKDEFDKSFVEQFLKDTVPLHTQGDGMRSFTTVLLHVLVANNHTIQFLDEPEAFLHPPQARLLGEYIAQKRRGKSQLFIATHSTDILDGLLASGASKVRIIRIQRDGKINKVKELSKEKTQAIAKDALTKYSGVFKGIFYKHVIITESDGDCQFYSSFLSLKSISGEKQPDVLFIHASGKHRMGQLVETLKSLDVPVTVIADIDILNEENTFKGLFEKLNGTWADLATPWRAIKNDVEARRPPLSVEQVKKLIFDQLNPISGTGPLPKPVENSIKQIFKTLSPWGAIKQAGRSALNGPSVGHFDDISRKCAEKGLWIVPVGELEGFCRSIAASHGPDFVEKVLEERDIENDAELHEARTFVKNIWAAANKIA